jgi:protein SCO1/2
LSAAGDLDGMNDRVATPRQPRTRGRIAQVSALLCGAALVIAACGSDDGGDSSLSGIVRDPAPQVDLVSLPSLSDPGTDVEFRADDGEIQVVYFGFTNCPDVCPTTLADLTVALRMLEPEQAEDVEVVMVGVDPERDNAVLDQYVTTFISDAIAAGSDDTELLDEAGEPFGASWEVRTAENGDIEVDHSPVLYAVDDQGRLVLTWQFGASAEDMAADLSELLERSTA